MKRFFQILANRESGQDLVEYSLLLTLLTLASAGLFLATGKNVKQVWTTANTVLSKASPDARH